MPRQAIEEALQRMGAPADSGLDRVRELLGDFASRCRAGRVNLQ
jgi:hypothetical protein